MNYKTLAQHKKMMIRNKFCFLWISWFFWFLFLALAYVPFGAQLNEFLKELSLGWVTVYEYERNVPALDTAFVTPLVVTQLLNLFLRNYMPYWMRMKQYKLMDALSRLSLEEFANPIKRRITAVGDALDKYKASRYEVDENGNTVRRASLGALVWKGYNSSGDSAVGSSIDSATEDAIVMSVQESPLTASTHPPLTVTTGQVDGNGNIIRGQDGSGGLEIQEPPPDQGRRKGPKTAAHRLVQALEEMAQSSSQEDEEARLRWAVRAHSGDANHLTATLVIRQSKLPEFHCFGMYLQIVIQFSYITMFAVVWPLVGVCAVGNNWLVFKAQVFSLIRSHRRPVPSRVADVGIGEWGTLMLLQVITISSAAQPGLHLALCRLRCRPWLCRRWSCSAPGSWSIGCAARITC